MRGSKHVALQQRSIIGADDITTRNLTLKGQTKSLEKKLAEIIFYFRFQNSMRLQDLI